MTVTKTGKGKLGAREGNILRCSALVAAMAGWQGHVQATTSVSTYSLGMAAAWCLPAEPAPQPQKVKNARARDELELAEMFT